MSISVDPDLRALMPHTITLRPWAGQNEFGEPTFGAPVTIQARVEQAVRLVRAVDGQERVSMVTIYLASPTTIDPRSQITLPDGSAPPIMAITAIPDENGAYVTTIRV